MNDDRVLLPPDPSIGGGSGSPPVSGSPGGTVYEGMPPILIPAEFFEASWDGSPESVVTYPVYDDDDLGAWRPRAASVGAYNGRLLLGDVAYDPPRPNVREWFAVSTGTSMWIRLGIDIATASGTVTRYSEPVRISSASARNLTSWYETAGYPDRRVVRWRILMARVYNPETGSGIWYNVTRQLPDQVQSRLLMRPGSGNFAYADMRGLSLNLDGLSTGDQVPTDEIEAANRELDYDPNRVMVSDVMAPHVLRARRVAQVGEKGDHVLGFASHAEPVSQGQFGEYPLLIFCNKSITTAHPGDGDMAFGRYHINVRRGTVGRYAFTQADNTIAFAANDGVWLMAPESRPQLISDELNYISSDGGIYAAIGPDTVLASWRDERQGRRELWMAAGKLIFAFSFATASWFIIDRVRRFLLGWRGVMLGVPDSGFSVMEEEAEARPIMVYMRSVRLHLGGVGIYKRVRRLWLRQQRRLSQAILRLIDRADGDHSVLDAEMLNQRDVMDIPAAMVREPYVEVHAMAEPGQTIDGFGVEYDMRLRHRAPDTVPDTRYDLVWTALQGLLRYVFIREPVVTIGMSGEAVVAEHELDVYPRLAAGQAWMSLSADVIPEVVFAWPSDEVQITPSADIAVRGTEDIVLDRADIWISGSGTAEAEVWYTPGYTNPSGERQITLSAVRQVVAPVAILVTLFAPMLAHGSALAELVDQLIREAEGAYTLAAEADVSLAEPPAVEASAMDDVTLGRMAEAVGDFVQVDTDAVYPLTSDDEAAGEVSYVAVDGDALEAFVLADDIDANAAFVQVDAIATHALTHTEAAEGESDYAALSGEAAEAFEFGHTLSITSGDQQQEEAQTTTPLVIVEVAEGQVPDEVGAAEEAIELARTSEGESVLLAEDSAATLALDIASETATGEASVVSTSAAAGEALTLGADLSVTSSDQDQEEALVSVSLGVSETATGEAEHLSASVSETVTLGAEVSHDYQPRPEESRTVETALGVSEAASGEYVIPPAQSSAAAETVALGRVVSATATDQDTEDTQATTALTIVETAVGTAEHLAAAVSEAVTLGRAAEGSHTPKPEVSRTAETAIGRSEAASGVSALPPAVVATASESVTLGREESATAIDQDQEDTQASRTLSITETAVGTAEHLTASVSETLTLGRSSAGTGAEPVAVSRTATHVLSISESAAGAFSLPPAITAAASEGVTLGRDQSTTVQDQDQEDTQASRALGRTEVASGTAEHLNAATSESRTLGKTAAGSVVAIPDVSRSATRVLTRYEWGFGSASAATPVSRAVVESRTLGKTAAGSIYVPPQDAAIQITYTPSSVGNFNQFDRNPDGTAHIQIRASYGQVYSSQYVYMVGDPPDIGIGGPDAWVNAETVHWGETVPLGWSLLQIQLPFNGSWININLNPSSIPAGRTVTSLPGQIRIVKPPL